MKYVLLFLLVAGCVHKNEKKSEFDKWIKEAEIELLVEDRKNKELELIYLEEMGKAQDNYDIEAYEFFFNEYIAIPRLDIPDRLKTHELYFIGGDKVKY